MLIIFIIDDFEKYEFLLEIKFEIKREFFDEQLDFHEFILCVDNFF